MRFGIDVKTFDDGTAIAVYYNTNNGIVTISREGRDLAVFRKENITAYYAAIGYFFTLFEGYYDYRDFPLERLNGFKEVLKNIN